MPKLILVSVKKLPSRLHIALCANSTSMALEGSNIPVLILYSGNQIFIAIEAAVAKIKIHIKQGKLCLKRKIAEIWKDNKKMI